MALRRRWPARRIRGEEKKKKEKKKKKKEGRLHSAQRVAAADDFQPLRSQELVK
jgi:hypothetical protein